MTWGLSRFSRSENGTVPLGKWEVILGQPPSVGQSRRPFRSHAGIQVACDGSQSGHVPEQSHKQVIDMRRGEHEPDGLVDFGKRVSIGGHGQPDFHARVSHGRRPMGSKFAQSVRRRKLAEFRPRLIGVDV